MKLRVLSESDVRAVLKMAAAIDLQAEAFGLLARKVSVDGLRSFASSESPPGVAIFNPSFLRQGKGYGIKVVSDFYENGKLGAPRMNALVALFSGRTGQPQTVMEAGFLTDVRTGAGTALAARHLARKDSRLLTIFGAGRVARNQLQALCQEFPIKRVLVVTRTRSRGEAFVKRMRGVDPRIPHDIRLLDDPAAAVREADMVVCATTAHTPVFPGTALRRGTFVAGTGAYDASMREVDSETIRRASKRVIDSRNDCLDDAGDFVIPIQEGVLRRDDVAEIAEVVAGKRPGRETDDEITYYKSVGVPIQDLITAQHVEQRAVKDGIGTMIEIGGDHD